MKRIKVGIIGQGRSGRDIHRHLLENSPALRERFDVVAVSDAIAERTAPSNAGANPSCRRYSDYRELLKDGDVELVVNASRSLNHVKISAEAMEKGFDVLCEKPLADTVAEVDHVLAVSRKTGRFFAVYQQARFRPLYRKIFEIIQSGVLGRISEYKVFYTKFGRRWDWQTIQDMNGGELMNTAPHPLDQMVELWESFGDSDPEVFCRLQRIHNAGDAEDNVKLILTGKDHPVFDLEVSSCNHFQPYVYQVYGEDGSLAATNDTIFWKYYKPELAPCPALSLDTLEAPGRLPLYCGESLDFFEESCKMPTPAGGFDSWGTEFYLNLYEARQNGAPLAVKLSQVRRQISIIEECRRQNPLPKTVTVPPGTF